MDLQIPTRGTDSRIMRIALGAIILFIAAVVLPPHANAQSAKGETQRRSFDPAPVVDSDDATNVKATSQLMSAVRSMVYAEDFDRLDALASAFRKNKSKFSGGMWKIHIFYGGTGPFGHATEEDWKTLEGILTRWVAAKPKSVTARVALAQMYLGYAWSARGGGFADSVSDSGWRLFESRVSQAKQALDSAKGLPEMCPEWYLVMQGIAIDQSWTTESVDELLKIAVSFEPGYYYYFRMHSLGLLPKWGGEPGEAEEFITQSADRVGGAEGDILYFQLASFLVNQDRDAFRKLSFDRIRRGFTQSERVYGASLTNMNLFAYMARLFDEAGVANAVFNRIGDQWSEDLWHTKDAFDTGKKWAAELAEVFPDTSVIEEVMKTPEGRRFDAEFRTKFADLIQNCIGKADPAEGPARLLAVVLEDGTLSQLRSLRGNSKSVCLFQTVHQKLSPPSRAPFKILLEFDIPVQPAPE